MVITGDRMQIKFTLYGTDIYEKICDLDLDRLEKICDKHRIAQSTRIMSNRGGGYQGHEFQDHTFIDMIMNCWPKNTESIQPTVQIQAWLNVNGFGAWNALHNHLDTNALLSGVFYVKVPEDSGNIFFYDPRFLSSVGTHYQYYYPNDGGYFEITPKPNMLLFFPPSLFHMVGPNLTQHERYSIAFNVMVASSENIK